MRIYLLGFMGCGKSSLGRRLARRLDYPFVDLDRVVEDQEGQDIPGIFAQKGEDWFRQREQKALHETVSLPRAVIATGGGTPCFFDNMEFMNRHGVTVYLKMSTISLSHRLEYARKKRPLIGELKGEELHQHIRSALEEREPVYMQAHCIIKGETAKPSQIASLVFGM